MNFWDILILCLIGGAVGTAARILYGKKKRGGGCTCGCSGCAKDCPARQKGKEKTNS